MANVKFYIQGDNTNAMRAFSQVKGAAGNLAGTLNSHLKGAIAGAFGVAAIEETIRRTIEYADNVDEASSRIDVGIEKLQEWTFAAKQAGAELEDVVNISEKLSQLALKDPAKLSVRGIDPNQTPEQLMTALNKFVMKSSQSESISFLKEFGGKSAGKMFNMLSVDLEETAKKAREMGAVMDTETTVKLAILNDQFSIMAQIIYAHVGPALIALALWAGGVWKKSSAFVEKIGTIAFDAFSGNKTIPREAAIEVKTREINKRIEARNAAVKEPESEYFRDVNKPIPSSGKGSMNESFEEFDNELQKSLDELHNFGQAAADAAKNRGKQKIGKSPLPFGLDMILDADKFMAEYWKKFSKTNDPNISELKNPSSMVSIGGLAGVDAQYRLEKVNKDILKELQRIANLIEAQSKLPVEGSFP
jgi:hypothetical protein